MYGFESLIFIKHLKIQLTLTMISISWNVFYDSVQKYYFFSTDYRYFNIFWAQLYSYQVFLSLARLKWTKLLKIFVKIKKLVCFNSYLWLCEINTPQQSSARQKYFPGFICHAVYANIKTGSVIFLAWLNTAYSSEIIPNMRKGREWTIFLGSKNHYLKMCNLNHWPPCWP